MANDALHYVAWHLKPRFTALHGMQARYSDVKAVRLSVRPSICLSVKRVDCDKTKDRSVQTFIPYER